MPTGIYMRTSENTTRYWLGKKRSPETIEKIRNKLTGRKITDQETLDKYRERMSKNPIKYWLGKKQPKEMIDKRVVKIKQVNGSLGENHWTKRPEVRLKMGLSRKGRPSPKKGKEYPYIIPWNKGLRGYNAGAKCGHWRGGITPINKKIRNSPQYKDWRNSIYKRDNYTCQNCGACGVHLNADHYPVPFSAILSKLIVEQGLDNLFDKAMRYSLFWDTDNGRTLCKKCHKEIGWSFFKENNPKKKNA